MATAYPAGGYSPSAFSFMAALPVAVPATLAASGVYSSGVVAATGYNGIAVSAELSQVGTLSLQRYTDAAGTLPLGAAISQTLTANTLGTVWANDGQPWASFFVTVTNTSGSTANVTSVSALLSALRT